MSKARGMPRWWLIVLGAVLGTLLGWAAASYAERFNESAHPSTTGREEAR